MTGLASGTSHFVPSLRKTSGLRFTATKVAVTFVFACMVISSPIFTFVDPTQLFAATVTNNLNRIDSSNYHSTPLISESVSPSSSATPTLTGPSTLSQDGDFTTQAALSLTRATQTSSIVNSKSYYDIMFRTITAGIIKTIEMDFPDGTYVGASLLVEAIGIGPGTITADNFEDKITYTVTNAVNVPANTKIRIQLSNINNPQDPGFDNNMVTITTKDAANTIIDGPTPTNPYNIKQIGTADIADQAITSSAIATSFAYQREVADGVNGWDPNSATTTFIVDDPLITSKDQRILVNLDQPGGPVCSGIMSELHKIAIDCTSDPVDGTTLRYAVFSPSAP